MIHAITVTPDTALEDLRKLYRKKLMTGGAVLRLAPDLCADDLELMFERFSTDAGPNNLQTEVLEQIARHEACGPWLAEKLSSLNLPRVSDALRARRLLPLEDGAARREVIAAECSKLEQMSSDDLRRYFLRHIGEDDDALTGRLALCRCQNLPTDLSYLLERDSDSTVRFHARYQAEISR